MDGLRAWAPEVIYDNEADLYYVYFSDPHDDIGKIYRVTSTDLESFSYPKVMLDTGYPVIDMTIFPMNGLYWMIYKDERAGALTVYPGYTSSLEEGFQKVLDWKYLIPERPVEGPTVFQDMIRESTGPIQKLSRFRKRMCGMDQSFRLRNRNIMHWKEFHDGEL